MLPDSLKKIALFLERLPGIGQKTANRLALYLLRMPEKELQEFSKHIAELKAKTKRCSICMNLSEEITCEICLDKRRDRTIITVVETPLDLLSFEHGNIYNGVYHVLHGRIDPLNNIGPDDIFIQHLLNRLQNDNKETPEIKEIILATNPDMEGEATAMYIQKQVKSLSAVRQDQMSDVKVTRLAYGLPVGASVEYADYGTLGRALENRRDF